MRLTFFVNADLRVGRGVENTLFKLLKYKPKNIEITIIEITRTDNNPLILSNSEVNELTKNCKIIRVTSKFETLKKDNNSKIGILYRDLMANRTVYSLKHTPQTTLEEMKDTDIVYLFNNQLAIFFSDTNVPVIGSEHTFDFSWIKTTRNQNRFYKIYHKLMYKKFYTNISFFHLFAGGEDKLNDLKQYFNYELKETAVLPSGVDTSLFYPDYNANNKKIKFLFVASLIEEKGLDLLLPLIDRIDNNGVEFHIAGGGELADKIKANKRIIYHGILSNIDLGRLYRECDIFIYPSHADTFSLVTLQA